MSAVIFWYNITVSFNKLFGLAKTLGLAIQQPLPN